MSRPFSTVLVANRGEIAVRVISALRDLGLRAVAVYSDADRLSRHVEIADEAVHIGPPSPALSYLNIEALIDWRRTCLPRITQRPGGVPGRLYYGQGERQTNPNIPETSAQPARNDNDPAGCT